MDECIVHHISLSLMNLESHILMLQYLGLCPSLRQIVLMTFVNLMDLVMFLRGLSLGLGWLLIASSGGLLRLLPAFRIEVVPPHAAPASSTFAAST